MWNVIIRNTNDDFHTNMFINFIYNWNVRTYSLLSSIIQYNCGDNVNVLEQLSMLKVA